MDGLFSGKSQSNMDDDWGYPYFKKPPCVKSHEIPHLSLPSYGTGHPPLFLISFPLKPLGRGSPNQLHLWWHRREKKSDQLSSLLSSVFCPIFYGRTDNIKVHPWTALISKLIPCAKTSLATARFPRGMSQGIRCHSATSREGWQRLVQDRGQDRRLTKTGLVTPKKKSTVDHGWIHLGIETHGDLRIHHV